MPSKRRSYCADFKLQVVKYAAEHGNRAAERSFGVNEKLVRDWRKAEEALSTMRRSKRANRGLKARWPQLEEHVHRWVLDQRAAGRGLSTAQMRLHAQLVAKAMNIRDFAGGPSWCYRFMQRNRLSMRARPQDQDLPGAVQEHGLTPEHGMNGADAPPDGRHLGLCTATSGGGSFSTMLVLVVRPIVRRIRYFVLL